MQIKKNEIGKIFKKLGLEVRSTKHRYGWFTFQGIKILRVHYSHGKGSIPGRVSDKIRSQLKLTQKDFRNLIDCPLSLEDYETILKGKGLI
ncbi:MAG: hypothetical protein JRJ86_19385 [Deltaproteobacteria bacterium]|nr:hypothetical protein [Deltaproteobacteria bacterium]MBW2346091.1 hypothetical protein [Deltaproteobacteria bacterium]